MISDADFRQLLEAFDRPWTGYRKVRKGVKKRIGRHMQALGCRSMTDYLALLGRQPGVRHACGELLAITISRFFRDRRLWDQLVNRILPELARRLPECPRAWSAGCAAGEEPYSLVIAWDLMRECADTGAELDILASDALEDNLRRARRGVYPASALREVPAAVKGRYFIEQGRGRRFDLIPAAKAAVQLLHHDLLREPPPPGRFDLLFLRNNLLTYHRGPALENAFERLMTSLRPNGILVVGSHEHPPEGALLIRDGECPWVYTKPA